MSRSDYSEDFDDSLWQLICWRGAVESAISGKRGQAFFRDLLVALDALPENRLIAEELIEQSGSVCALGALGKARAIDMRDIDPENFTHVAKVFGIANALAREVVYINDEAGWYDETPEQRFTRVRAWVASNIWEWSDA